LDLEAKARALGECELVFHLAADPEVRLGAENPDSHFTRPAIWVKDSLRCCVSSYISDPLDISLG